MIPDDVKEQIRDAADIVQVIGQHVQLRRAGRSWKGLCPFHGEKTPSFNVIPDKRFFHCFGCQKHGDVFDFVMELEGKSFVEAAEQLAERYGITIARVEESPELRRARGERIAMLDLNKLATAFYREVLADPKRGEAGRAYLAKRGVGQETSDKFQLGYAPSDWGALADHLKAKRADLELAVKLGLLAHRPRTGGYYDRNRDRLVCPVIQPGGDVVGFSSRVVGTAPPAPDGSEPPKYINSPESTVYKKSKLLFGLAQAREAMAVTKRVVLVEGNFDVITLHQAGFTDVVAPLGTALTAEQVNVLRRMADRVVLLYDGDRAGYKATMHALQLCVEQDVEVLVASSPGHGKSGGRSGPLADGVDPDSLVAGGGAEHLREAIDRAKGGIEFFAFEVWSKARGNVDARARALDDAARLVAKVASPMKRDLIVSTLATAMEIDVGVVRSAIARAGAQGGHGGGGSGGAHSSYRDGGPRPGPRDGGGYRGGAQRDGGYRDGGPRGGGPRDGGYRDGGPRDGFDDGPANAPHPNAPGGSDGDRGAGGDQRPDLGRLPAAPSGPPPAEEVELIALFTDHPSLIATPEADKAFWLLTDARLRDMYSAARAGQSLHELAASSGQLPSPTTVQLLSGKYADSKDPLAALVVMTSNLAIRKTELERAELKKNMVEAGRRGNQDKARLLAQLGIAERKGDHDEVARLKASLAEHGVAGDSASNRKQVD